MNQKIRRFDDGGDTTVVDDGSDNSGLAADVLAAANTPDLSSLSSLGGGDSSNLSSLVKKLKFGNLGGASSDTSSTDLSSLMDQAYGTASTGGGQSFDLSSLFSGPADTNQSSAETARLLAAASGSDTSGASGTSSSMSDFLSGLTNGGVQDFGTGSITDQNLQGMQDAYSKADTTGGFTSGWQNVGDNKIMVHDDGTATGINTVTGDTFTLPASTVDTMSAAGVLNSASSGYNAVTGGTNIAPGGGTVVTNADGTKTITTPDGKTVTIDKTGTVINGTNGKDGTNTNTTKTTNTTTQQQQPKDNSTSNILALLALMALMDKGGSSGSNFQIPLFNAQRGVIPGSVNYTKAAGGGMMGGIGSLDGHLGGYSDGGRLLKGPGDGVSDDIPATIGGKEPARLADGEFVVPARIVSELGNGSTDAGARKLYAMMDRIKADRSKAKDIAADTKADKHLPA